MLCCRLWHCVEPSQEKKWKKWLCTHRFPPGQLAWRKRRRRSTYRCRRTLSLLDWTAAGYMFLFVCVCICVVSECALTRQPPLTSPGRLAGGVQGKRVLRCSFYQPPWQLPWWRPGWKVCCSRFFSLDPLRWLSQECSAAVSGVMLQTVPDLCSRKTQAWKEVA